MLAIEFIPFLFLTFSLLSLWLRDHGKLFFRHVWQILLSLSCISALFLEQMESIGILITILVAGLAWCAGNIKCHPTWRWITGLLFICCALLLGLHIFPGFHSLNIMKNVTLTPDAIPYSLYFNIDKTLIGLLIFGFWYSRPAKPLSWSATSVTLLKVLPLIIGSVIILSYLINYIQFAPKVIDGLGLWMWANLFFTCTAEEAFFRGLIQKQLSLRLQNYSAGKWIALSIAAILFGLAHLGGGWMYVGISILAGFGYGMLYQLTGRIEASILSHFILNLSHILFFTYPALAAS